MQGEILTAAALDTVNDFDRPDEVKPVDFRGASLSQGVLQIAVPAKSVVMLRLR